MLLGDDGMMRMLLGDDEMNEMRLEVLYDTCTSDFLYRYMYRVRRNPCIMHYYVYYIIIFVYIFSKLAFTNYGGSENCYKLQSAEIDIVIPVVLLIINVVIVIVIVIWLDVLL